MTAEEFEVEQWQIDGMLRHLWMFQVEIEEETEEEQEAEPAQTPPKEQQ